MDLFVNESKLHRVSRPVAVLHGTEDRVVPHSHGVGLDRIARRTFPMLSVPVRPFIDLRACLCGRWCVRACDVLGEAL